MGKRMFYKKHRCMLCDKKAVEENEGIYLCKVHRSKKLEMGKEYTLKNLKKVIFYDPNEKEKKKKKKN